MSTFHIAVVASCWTVAGAYAWRTGGLVFDLFLAALTCGLFYLAAVICRDVRMVTARDAANDIREHWLDEKKATEIVETMDRRQARRKNHERRAKEATRAILLQNAWTLTARLAWASTQTALESGAWRRWGDTLLSRPLPDHDA